MSWYRKPHWRILVALALGLVYGVVAATAGWREFTADWVAPFGTIFLRLLLLIAVPLVLASLITGIASLSDLKKLSRIGGKTIGIYVGTTLIALIIGLTLVNLLQPGARVPDSVRAQLQETYQSDVTQRELLAESASERGPLQPLVDMVPDNIFGAATSNRNMLNMVFIAFLFGTALMLIPKEQAGPLLALFASVNAVIIKIVELVIVMAPLGVFALIADTVTGLAGDSPSDAVQLLGALGFYAVTVLLGLAVQMLVTYPLLLRLFTPVTRKVFFPGIAQAQLVAFSTSSSAATLPVTMRSVQAQLGGVRGSLVVRPAARGDHQHGWDGPVPGGGGGLHRADTGYRIGFGRADDHHRHGPAGFDRHGRGAERGGRDAHYYPRSRGRARGRYCADPRP